jgi:hypothetical protein
MKIPLFIILFFMGLFYFFLGCTSVPKTDVGPGPAPTATPASQATQKYAWNHPDWDLALIKEISNRYEDFNKAQDMIEWCPQYPLLSKEQRVQVWGALFVALSKPESGWNPKSKYTESNGSVSQGLFQLTYGDNSTYCPDSKTEADLDDPLVNIHCAINLAANYVAKDSVVASGGYVSLGTANPHGLARYWAVIRSPDSKSKHQKEEIRAKVKAFALCD